MARSDQGERLRGRRLESVFELAKVKNLPPELHRSLKENAKRHKRSLNKEAIHLLESALIESRTRRISLLDRPTARSTGRILVPVEEVNARATDLLDREG